ncbi:Uncharacterised protein [Chromobacterium violaceum]|uniref:Lipoprotein n=1 Tax=Chromobacterium violaceum TaxID=536 RepID=A0A447TBS1_CHRVL|nr:Uncharacterised protein [Chromobacterium violaceum]
MKSATFMLALAALLLAGCATQQGYAQKVYAWQGATPTNCWQTGARPPPR